MPEEEGGPCLAEQVECGDAGDQPGGAGRLAGGWRKRGEERGMASHREEGGGGGGVLFVGQQ